MQGPAPGSIFKGSGLQLDLILRVFSNLNESVTL